MIKFLFSILMLYPFSTFAAEGTFWGLYKATFGHEYHDQIEIEFLIDSKNNYDLKAQNSGGNIKLIRIEQKETDHSFGPNMQTLSFLFEAGSDEDGIVYSFELGWLGLESDRQLTLLSNLMLHVDGKNDFQFAERDRVTLYKWDKEKKNYQQVPNLF